jgi:hypothetical protein
MEHQVTFQQANALNFAREVLENADTANALDAYNRLDRHFARDVDNRSVDFLMSDLERLF